MLTLVLKFLSFFPSFSFTSLIAIPAQHEASSAIPAQRSSNLIICYEIPQLQNLAPHQALIDQMMEPEPQKPVWCERKQAAVQEELKRMIHLPPNSSYVSHRRKVLNKILELISVQRTISQEKELELLFAGLSL